MAYDVKISLKKFGTGLGYAFVPFFLSYTIGFLETEEFPLEYAAVITLAIGVLHFIANWLKHKND